MGSMNEVLDKLYVGGLASAHNSQLLKLNEISHILSVTCCSVLTNKKANIVTKCVPLVDSSDQHIIHVIPQTNDFIHEARLANGHVLVHCIAGVSRSVSLVCAYLISWCGLDTNAAIQVVQYYRPSADPNNGFRAQLANFYLNNSKEEHERLKRKYGDRMLEEDVQCCKDAIAKCATAKFFTAG